MAAYRRVDDLQSPAGWLPVHQDQLRAQRSVSSMGSLYLYLLFSRYMTCQSNNSQGCGHDHLPKLPRKNGKMLISQLVTSCLTNHSELCVSCLLNDQSRRSSIYRLQLRPSFVGKFSVSSALLASAGPVVVHYVVACLTEVNLARACC